MQDLDPTPPRRISWIRRLGRIPGQFFGVNPFEGDCLPSRVPIFFSGLKRPSQPFPHPWNYHEPIRILESYFVGTEKETGPGRHNRYLDFPGFSPVLVTRDPAVIRAILTSTGDKSGQFDRDTLPSTGIARATGKDTLLFSNGPFWRRQRKVSASPFGKTALYQDDVFEKFEVTFRKTVRQRLAMLRQLLEETGKSQLRIKVEPEIKALMLELLADSFFGACLEYDTIRDKYVPALERVIDHIVRDTVTNRLRLPLSFLALFSRRCAQAQKDFATFEELTDRVLECRNSEKGMWKYFQSDASDDQLRSNIKVFLAGALEATTSYATWAISHLARDLEAQEKVHAEVLEIQNYSPECLSRAKYFSQVLEETLRLTPSLYFLPRRATADTWVQTSDGRSLKIPQGTHILLDVWHANRLEEIWGTVPTGFPADQFAPARWDKVAEQSGSSKDWLHFGFGHGARVCPGKHLGQLEVSLVVGAFVKVFRFQAVNEQNSVNAGVSTKPADGTFVDLELRPDHLEAQPWVEPTSAPHENA